jgi:tetratricopeptide (TPR) repeat protein
MNENPLLKQAIQAIRSGKNVQGRDLLAQVLRQTPQDPEAWLWMSAVVRSEKERIYCLQQVLKYDPGNLTAKRGLTSLGVSLEGEPEPPTLPTPRKWSLETPPETGGDLEKTALPGRNKVSLALAGVALCFLLSLGMVNAQNQGWFPFAPRLTVTPVPWSPTPTLFFTPTVTPLPSPTPTYPGPTPLAMLLEATYTPTPLFVVTPHPISEAFRTGIRAYERGELSLALELLTQAAEVETRAADIQYLIGEIYRLLGQPDQALQAYEASLSLNPDFAPAYLGRARVSLQADPDAAILEDLNRAIHLDAGLGEAWLERAAYYLRSDEPDPALEDANQAVKILPQSPLGYLYQAQAYLALQDPQTALVAALTAYNLDLTLLPVYQALGQAYLLSGLPLLAVEPLEIYSVFHPEDPGGWALLAQAYADMERYADALQAVQKTLELEENPAMLTLRGTIYLSMGNGQQAVNDFMQVREHGERNFDNGLLLGRALFAAGRLEEAIAQYTSLETPALEAEQRISLYYWRGLAYDQAKDSERAIRDWQGLLAEEKELVPLEWIQYATQRLKVYLQVTASSTPGGTRTLTVAPGVTPAQDRTPTPAP